jgi:hypothetical protein
MDSKLFVKMKRVIRRIPFAALFLFVFAGCEDAFVKVIDVDQAEFPPRLSVTATLDTDGGRFTLMMKEAHSIAYYKTFQSNQKEIVRDGIVRLFENDVEIFSIPGPFDLSVGDYTQNGYYKSSTGVSTVAGYTYRLEIDVEGYDKATATAIMPGEPIISGLQVDVEHLVKKENVKHISSLESSSYAGYNTYYMPFSLNIADNTPSPDFYSFQLEYYIETKYPEEYSESNYTDIINIATSNLALIQDNPDVESRDILMEGENVDVYSFDLMMFTDATFANENILLDLYSPYNYAPEQFEYDPNQPSAKSSTFHKYTLIARHYTPEAFRQYRSMAFQLAGLGFFTEPVYITSNMENAYGGFSVQNTKRFILYEEEK